VSPAILADFQRNRTTFLGRFVQAMERENNFGIRFGPGLDPNRGGKLFTRRICRRVADAIHECRQDGRSSAPPLKGRGGLGAKFELTLGEVPTRHQSQPLSAPIAFLYFIFRQTLHFSSNLWRDVDLFAASDPSSLFLFQFVTARDFSVVLWVRVPNTLEVNSRLTKHLQIVRSKPHSSVIITVISVTNLVDCWKLSQLIITRIGSVM
jgi:hypothetical protein